MLPRPRSVGMFLLLVLPAVVAPLAISKASSSFSGTTSNSGNSFAASSCFQPVPVSVGNTYFSPAELTIAAGCSVAWTQTSSTNHTTTNTTPSLGSLWNSGNIGQNNTYTREFASAGAFPYKCTRHPGQQGTITVE